MICTSPILMNLSVAIVCLGCLWTHRKMREPNSSVVSEPSGSSGELYHRFLRHTKVVPRRWCVGHIFVFWWHDMSLQESHEQCVQWIVRFIHSQHSPKRIAFLYDCLAMAVETSLLPPRYTTLINTHSCFSSVQLHTKIYMFVHYVSVKDRVWSSHRLWKFGVGEDSAVGSDLQTDSEDYRRGGLQGLSLLEARTSGIHRSTTLTFCISS